MSDLDEKEQNRVRTALRHLRRRLGGWKTVAAALRFAPTTLTNVVYGNDAVSERMALRTARLLGCSVEDLLDGRYLPGACPRCGHVPDFGDEPTVVEDLS